MSHLLSTVLVLHVLLFELRARLESANAINIAVVVVVAVVFVVALML